MTTSPREALERLTRALSVQPDAPDERMFGVSAGDMRALLSLLEWRPISEAPKDGAWVLICGPDRGDVDKSKFDPEAGLWVDCWDDANECWQYRGSRHAPQRWMPMPPHFLAAPQEDKP